MRTDQIRVCRFFMIIACLVFSLSHTVSASPFYNTDSILADGKKAIKNGEFAEAAELYGRILDMVKNGNSDPKFCSALEFGGNANLCINRYNEALDFYTYAVKLAEKHDVKTTYANCMNNIGLVYAVFSDYDRAAWYFRRGCEAALKIDNNYLIGISATNLVRAYSYTGDVPGALKYYRLQSSHPLEDRNMQQFYLRYNQAMIAAARKDNAAALYYLRQALETVNGHNLPKSLRTDVESEFGRIFTMTGNADSAAYHYRQVTVLGNNPEKELKAFKALAKIYHEKGDSIKSSGYQADYIRLSDSIFDRQQFNSASDRLFSYENGRTEHRINNLKKWISSLAWGLILIAAVLIVIFYFNRRLKAAQKLLVNKNQELIRQNEEWKELRAKYSEVAHTGVADNGCEDSDSEGQEQASSDPKKISSAALGEERVKMMVSQIKDVLENSEIILTPDFNLDTLAKILDTNTRYVSMVINGSYGKTFKTLLNEYRIQEACKRLTDKDKYGHLTIAAIAQSVGYNSVNNFIIAFKKVNGMTPSQYIKLAGNQTAV